jgi:AcrR family transcriptional regulator
MAGSDHAKRHANTKVGRDEWALGALELIAEQGVAGLKIETLARRLGITKGSFYWHFTDRAQLIADALDLWLKVATLDIIERLAAVEDPQQRLQALFSESFGEMVDGPLDGLLLAQVEDPVVGPIVQRVTNERLAFLETAYRDLGLDRERATARARLVYAAYIGTTHLARVPAGDHTTEQFVESLQQELAILLTP